MVATEMEIKFVVRMQVLKKHLYSQLHIYALVPKPD